MKLQNFIIQTCVIACVMAYSSELTAELGHQVPTGQVYVGTTPSTTTPYTGSVYVYYQGNPYITNGWYVSGSRTIGSYTYDPTSQSVSYNSYYGPATVSPGEISGNHAQIQAVPSTLDPGTGVVWVYGDGGHQVPVGSYSYSSGTSFTYSPYGPHAIGPTTYTFYQPP